MISPIIMYITTLPSKPFLRLFGLGEKEEEDFRLVIVT